VAAACVLAACLAERGRPSPPQVRLTLFEDTVGSPDTLRGSFRVEDVDGIDSVWISLDTQRAGTDGFFERLVNAQFRFGVPAGLDSGTVLDIRLEARDITGFVATLDTFVVVVP
jgi:hypothetical protein